MNWFRSAIIFLGSLSVLSAAEPVLPAEKLAAALKPETEVQFLCFTGSGTVVIGSVAPYGSRAGTAEEDVSILSWKSRVPANWAEWDPATGTLTQILTATSATEATRKLGLSPALPAGWEAGDEEKLLQRLSSAEAQAALKPKSHKPEVNAVSPDGKFAAVMNHEESEDELGTTVFLHKGKGGWKRVGEDRPGVFISSPMFSPDGSLLAYQYQTNGYDGPQPWALVVTKSGVDLLAEKSNKLLPYAIAVRSDAVAIGWSDGSVTVRNLSKP